MTKQNERDLELIREHFAPITAIEPQTILVVLQNGTSENERHATAYFGTKMERAHGVATMVLLAQCGAADVTGQLGVLSEAMALVFRERMAAGLEALDEPATIAALDAMKAAILALHGELVEASEMDSAKDDGLSREARALVSALHGRPTNCTTGVTCAACGHVMTAGFVSLEDENLPPPPGAALFCSRCGSFLIFCDDGAVRIATSDEVAAIESDPNAGPMLEIRASMVAFYSRGDEKQ